METAVIAIAIMVFVIMVDVDARLAKITKELKKLNENKK